MLLGTELLYEKNPGQAMHSFLLYFFYLSVVCGPFIKNSLFEAIGTYGCNTEY